MIKYVIILTFWISTYLVAEELFLGNLDENRRPHGYGRLSDNSERLIYGLWVHGELQTNLVYITESGWAFEGSVLLPSYYPHGNGTLTFPNGNRISGHWVHGYPVTRLDFHIQYMDGWVYNGPIDEGYRPHGFGNYIDSSETQHRGFWVHGRFMNFADSINTTNIPSITATPPTPVLQSSS